MPLSFDEATRRYESSVKNIQDSIFTLESLMGSNLVFSLDMPQAIGTLDEVDTIKAERVVSLQLLALEEYRKMISFEKKRRAIADVIQEKQQIQQLKMQIKTKRQSERVASSPYSKYKQAPPLNTADAQPTNTVDEGKSIN